MCECRDCDNFKAKKREPQVGDRVKTEGRGVLGTLVALAHNKHGGSNDGRCLVFFDSDEYEGEYRLQRYTTKNLTVVE